MSRPLLVDGDNLAKRHIRASALDDLKAGEVWTGGTYGTLNGLAAFLKQPETRDIGPVIVFFDGGVPARRMKLIPGYRADRKKSKEKFTDEQWTKIMSQMHDIKVVLPLLGCRCASYTDREADDCVAAAAKLLLADGYAPVVYSSDKDLLQLVRWGCEVFDPLHKRWINKDNFTEVKGLPVDRWLLYRVLVGDLSDSIKGATQCGDVRALEIISEMPPTTVASVTAQLLELTKLIGPDSEELPQWRRNILKDFPRLRDVAQGIDLTSSFGPSQCLVDKITQPGGMDQAAFLRFCTRLRFESLMGNPSRVWEPFRRAYRIGLALV